MNKIESNDFSHLLELALSSDDEVSKISTKTITQDYRYKLPERFAKLIFLKLDQYPHLSNTAQPDNFLRILNIAIVSKTSSKYKEEIILISLEALQHSSGTVRENGRKIVNNFPFLFDFGIEDEMHAGEKQFTQLLTTIEKLLKQHQPRTIPAHLENTPPSVYKTLALTWHDMIMKYHLWEKLNYQERMVELDIPTLYKYDEDDEPEESYYSMSDWRENISAYLTVTDEQKCKRLLTRREQQATEFLDWALVEVGQEKHKTDIMQIAKRDDSFELTRILTGMLFEKINLLQPEPSDERIMTEHQKIVRAIQAMDNNTTLESVYGLNFTRMITGIASDEAWSAKPDKINLLPLLQAFDELHTCIDDIVEKIFKPEEAELQAALSQFSRQKNPIDYTEYRQVVHYMADWVLQSDHKVVLRKSPNQLAVILWALFHEVNPRTIIYGLENASLVEYGGWKSVSSLGATKTDMRFLLSQNMADPSILLIDDNPELSEEQV